MIKRMSIEQDKEAIDEEISRFIGITFRNYSDGV